MLQPDGQPPEPVFVDALCPTHGVFKARLWPNPVDVEPPLMGRCQECEAQRLVTEEMRARSRVKADRDAKISRLMEKAGIPARFLDRNFTGYIATTQPQRTALTACRRFAETWVDQQAKGGSLVLTGGPGTGKTHLACAVANKIIPEHLATVAFGTVASMLRHIKDTYRKDSGRSEQDAIKDLSSPDLLIVDEVGVQVGSDHEKLLLFEVFNERYQACKPTILISNLSADDLENFLGHRVMDRYRECGVVLAFDWQSYRGSKVAA